MATEIDLAGTSQSINLDSWDKALKSIAMVLLSFLFTLGLGGLAVYLYNNYVVPSTPDSVGKIDVMTEP